MLELFSARGASPPWDPLSGHCPWTPLGAYAAPRPPAQLGPMEISADGPLAHQPKFPTISLLHSRKKLEEIRICFYLGMFVLLRRHRKSSPSNENTSKSLSDQ